MFKLKKILVCIDLTRMDEYVVKYAKLVATTMKSPDVYYIHINCPFELPSAVQEKYPELYGGNDEDLALRMEKTVSMFFPNYKEYGPHFIVRDGSPSDRILDWSEVTKMDLMIMGKKSELKGKGVNPKKIVNISHCSVLFVPENPNYGLDKLFVPVDFSIRSKTAVEQALAIKKNNNAKILLQHVYYVPHDYHFTGKTYEQFEVIMRENSEEDLAKFISDNYPDEEFGAVNTWDDDDAPADKIYIEATRQNADLIILASRGRTKTASLLLGSVAIELIKYDEKIPYMVIKDKRENISFLRALLKG